MSLSTSAVSGSAQNALIAVCSDNESATKCNGTTFSWIRDHIGKIVLIHFAASAIIFGAGILAMALIPTAICQAVVASIIGVSTLSFIGVSSFSFPVFLINFIEKPGKIDSDAYKVALNDYIKKLNIAEGLLKELNQLGDSLIEILSIENKIGEQLTSEILEEISTLRSEISKLKQEHQELGITISEASSIEAEIDLQPVEPTATEVHYDEVTVQRKASEQEFNELIKLFEKVKADVIEAKKIYEACKR